MIGREYRRRKDSNVWHFHPRCQHYPAKKGAVVYSGSKVKPGDGEWCDECLAKDRADARAAKAKD